MCTIPGAHSEELAYGSSKLLPAEVAQGCAVNEAKDVILSRSEQWYMDVPFTELRMQKTRMDLFRVS